MYDRAIRQVARFLIRLNLHIGKSDMMLIAILITTVWMGLVCACLMTGALIKDALPHPVGVVIGLAVFLYGLLLLPFNMAKVICDVMKRVGQIKTGR